MKRMKTKNLYIIFGASHGLGKAILNHGLKYLDNEFVVIDREGRKSNRRVKAFKIDLSAIIGATQVKKIFAARKRKSFKNIYLINNASTVQPLKPFGAAAAEEIVAAAHVNFLNYALIINYFLELAGRFKKINKKILNITSGAAVSPHYGLASYCATKAALEMLTQCVFLEQQVLKQAKILACRPGVINTRMQKEIRRTAKKDFRRVEDFRKAHRENGLSDPASVAEKIFKILQNNKYWSKPIIDIGAVK